MFAEALIVTEEIYDVREYRNCAFTFDTYFTIELDFEQLVFSSYVPLAMQVVTLRVEDIFLSLTPASCTLP